MKPRTNNGADFIDLVFMQCTFLILNLVSKMSPPHSIFEEVETWCLSFQTHADKYRVCIILNCDKQTLLAVWPRPGCLLMVPFLALTWLSFHVQCSLLYSSTLHFLYMLCNEATPADEWTRKCYAMKTPKGVMRLTIHE